MYNKLVKLLHNEKGSAGESLYTVFFVMAIAMFTVFLVTVLTSFVTYSRLMGNIEQCLNNSAAITDASYTELTETDQMEYSEITDEMYDDFYNAFFSMIKLKTDEYEITDAECTLRYSTTDEFAILYTFSGNIKVNVSLFGKQISYINKPVEIMGKHVIMT